jgi:hypothetical protein
LTRYVANPVGFWLLHALTLPILSIVVLLMPIYFVLALWPEVRGESFDGGLLVAFLIGMTLAAYAVSGGFAAVYSALLALWQWWQGGHTFLEAMLLAWTLLALVFSAVTLADSFNGFNLHVTLACAAAMPIIWFMCLRFGITQRHAPSGQRELS